MKWIDLPHERPVATLMLLLSLTVLGGVAIFMLPLDFMPTVEEPFVSVYLEYPGSQPLENLRRIVEPLEEEIARVSDIESLTSEIEAGRLEVRAAFDWTVDLDLKKLEMREAVDRVRSRLPAGISLLRIVTWQSGPSGGAILEARVSAESDLAGSWEVMDRRIRRPLERVRGVAQVVLGGIDPQQVRVEVDPAALRRHGVDLRALIDALTAANLDLDAGAVRGDVLRYDVRFLGRFVTLEEIEALPLPCADGGSVRLSDVAEVAIREPRLDYARHLDRKLALSLQVFKESSANTVETVEALMKVIAEIEVDPELEGIQLLVWSNSGTEIRRALTGLRNAGMFGGLLVLIVLYLFLRRIHTTLIVAAAIPFSLVATCGVMFLLGSQFNVLTMLGLMLGVGMLVDNAVVVIENIHRLEAEGTDPAEAARLGTRQVALAVTAATATTVCVWSWLFFAQRDATVIYVSQVALTMCSAVICSLLVSLTFIPLAAARFAPPKPAAPGFILTRLMPAYRGLLDWTLRHRLITLAALLLLAASAYLPLSRIEKSSEPKFRQLFAQVFYRAQDPITLEIMESHIDRVEEWIEAHRDELGYDSLYSWFNESGEAVTRLYLDPETATEERIAELNRRLRDGIEPVAGMYLGFGREDWQGAGARRMVRLAVRGEDPEYLSELSGQVESILRRLPDVIDVFGTSSQGRYEARVLVDPEKARNLGLSPRQVADTVSLTYRGQSLRRFQLRATELEMLVTLPEDLKPGLASLDDLPIPREDGEPVPLGAVAEVMIARVDPWIVREDRQITSWLTTEFELEVTTEEAQERITSALAGLRLPEGYGWDWGAWGERRDEGLATMVLGVSMSLVAVLLLMAALFESFAQPLAILITLPPAFFGGFWLLWLLGFTLDAIAFTGVIILIGIVVNNGIVLVEHVNQLRGAGMGRREALIRGCGDRLRPVLMTAISTIFGLMPLAMSTFTVATAYIDSLAVTVIGGLTTSTLFTLVGLPVWYTTLEDLGQGLRRALPKRVQPETSARLPV